MIDIRTMGANDLPFVVALEMENLSPWSHSLLAEELEGADGIVLVALDEESEVVAWLCAKITAPEAELLKIAVKQRRRRQGVATTLFSSLCEELVQCGCVEFFLEVRAQNISAQKFYHTNGCVQVGQRVLYYVDPEDDALVLRRSLVEKP